jgi:hypothetical protein
MEHLDVWKRFFSVAFFFFCSFFPKQILGIYSGQNGERNEIKKEGS